MRLILWLWHLDADHTLHDCQYLRYFAFENLYFVTVGYFCAEGVPVCNCARVETIFENTWTLEGRRTNGQTL